MSIRLIANENISWRIRKFIPQWNILPANEINKGKDYQTFSFGNTLRKTSIPF